MKPLENTPEDKTIEISGDEITEIKTKKDSEVFSDTSTEDYSNQSNSQDPYNIPDKLNPDVPKIDISGPDETATDSLLRKTTGAGIITPENKPQSTKNKNLEINRNKEKTTDKEDFNKKSITKTIRTYQADVVDTMKKQKTSLTSMVLAEKKKGSFSKEKVTTSSTQKKPKNILIIGIIVLFILAGGYFSYLASLDKNTGSLEITEVEIPFLIFSNYTRELYLDRVRRDNIIKEMEREKKEISIPLGYIIQLYPTTDDDSKQFVVEKTDGYKLLVTTESYFDAIQAKTPPSLGRSLNSDFIIGYHSSLGNNPFLVFNVKSYNTAFAGMLDWEETMFNDLAPVFVRYDSTIDLNSSDFKDIVIVNKDVRALLNENGKIEFAYSFPNPNTLIITNNETTLKEMFRRVTNAQLERKN